MTTKFTILLTGPPESGKTAMVRHLANFVDPADSLIVYDGEDSYALPATAEPAPGEEPREVTFAVLGVEVFELTLADSAYLLDHRCDGREAEWGPTPPKIRIARGTHVWGCEDCGAFFQFDWGTIPCAGCGRAIPKGTACIREAACRELIGVEGKIFTTETGWIDHD